MNLLDRCRCEGILGTHGLGEATQSFRGLIPDSGGIGRGGLRGLLGEFLLEARFLGFLRLGSLLLGLGVELLRLGLLALRLSCVTTLGTLDQDGLLAGALACLLLLLLLLALLGGPLLLDLLLGRTLLVCLL